MSDTAAAALTREIADAGRSLGRLLAYNPGWPEGMDFSSDGFIRSFFAPILATPFAIVFGVILSTKSGTEPFTQALIWREAVAHLINVFGFALVVGALSRPLGFSVGYGAFITLANWATLFLTVAACLLAGLSFLGDAGKGLHVLLQLLLALLSLFIIWRAARETLSVEIGPPLLMVVLWVAVSFGAGQAAALLLALFGAR